VKPKKPNIDVPKNAKRGDVVKAPGGGATGIFVGREPGGLIWVSWEGTFEDYAEMCEAFDARARRRQADRPQGRGRKDEVTADVILDTASDLLRRHKADTSPYTVTFADKVFIHPLWLAINRRYDITLFAFRELLVALHRNGELSLSRADLVEVMDPLVVERSETRGGYYDRYHFVRVPAARRRKP
jgi:hypothetical protein